MCNLNIVLKPIGFKSIDGLFIERITTSSYLTNSDGDGAFISSKERLFKSVFKLDYVDFDNEIKHSEAIITHQRIATSGGVKEDTTQPFLLSIKNKKFVLAHNGVFRFKNINETSDKYKDKSDTMIYIDLLKKEFKSDIKEAIKKVHKKYIYESSSYSILIYDIKEKRAYYYKNSSTNINIFKFNKRGFYITTKDSNKLWLEEQNDVKKIEEIIPIPKKIYEFRYNSKKDKWVLRSDKKDKIRDVEYYYIKRTPQNINYKSIYEAHNSYIDNQYEQIQKTLEHEFKKNEDNMDGFQELLDQGFSEEEASELLEYYKESGYYDKKN